MILLVCHIAVDEIWLSSLRFEGICLYTALLSSHHSISVGLRSELWLDHQTFCCRFTVVTGYCCDKPSLSSCTDGLTFDYRGVHGSLSCTFHTCTVLKSYRHVPELWERRCQRHSLRNSCRDFPPRPVVKILQHQRVRRRINAAADIPKHLEWVCSRIPVVYMEWAVLNIEDTDAQLRRIGPAVKRDCEKRTSDVALGHTPTTTV